MVDIDLHEQMVTDTVEYRGKKVKFTLQKYESKDRNTPMLWYVDAQIEGFKKPFHSKMLTSIFAREQYEKAKQLTNPQDYLDALFADASKIISGTKCELLSADLDSISIMWYYDGRVQVETDDKLVLLIKNLIDHLDTDVSKLVLSQSGFI